jgi:hypothetical protein
MEILILSVIHKKQYAPSRERLEIPNDDEKLEPLRKLIRELVVGRSIDLICEESDPCYVSIAQEEAFMHGPRIRWKNINMTAQERLEAGIWCAILNCNRPQEPDANTGTTIYHRIPEDRTRENFFKDEIVKTVKEAGATSVLVLCGDAHTESLKTKLEAAGYQVEANHDLIEVKDWK